MSLSVAAMRILAEKGLTLDDVIAVAAANEAERLTNDGAAERRRAYDRDRKAKAKAGRNSTGNSTGIPTERTGTIPPEIPPESCGIPPESADTPRAHVRDIKPTLVITGEEAVAVVVSADDWPTDPKSWVPSLVEHAASPRLDLSKSQGLILTQARLSAWKSAGASWAHNVQPVITALTRKRGPPISSWSYFDGAIADAIALDRKALEIPEHPHERPDHNSPRSAPYAGQSRADANRDGAALALSRRRARNAGEGGGDHEGRPARVEILSG